MNSFDPQTIAIPHGHFIGGDPIGADQHVLDVLRPSDGRLYAGLPDGDADLVDRAVSDARRAFRTSGWAAMPPRDRAKILRRWADLIDADAPYLSKLEALGSTRPVRDAFAWDVPYSADIIRFFAEFADKHGGEVAATAADHLGLTITEPYGVIGAIAPWNFPLVMACWKLAPALAAGCTVVIKPSEYTSASLLEFMKLVIAEADIPPGVINVVTGYGAVVGEPLVTHPKVAKVAFTGGTATGARVNELAARSFKKVSLELGGKSPNVVFDDCILDDAVSGAISGIFAATGQTCIAGSRLLVQETIHDQFVEKLVAMAKQARLGNPQLYETQVGPVTTPPQYQKILGYIDIAKGEGARCVLGGGPAPKEEGGGKYFVKPTIFTGVDNKMRIAQEEVFGPVLSVIKFKDEEDAVRIANDIAYGLGSGVWTQSVRRAHTMARKIKAGTVWVNTYRAVSFTMPFGGYKASGLGRENGAEAIDGYLQSKSVWINNGTGGGNPFVMKTAG